MSHALLFTMSPLSDSLTFAYRVLCDVLECRRYRSRDKRNTVLLVGDLSDGLIAVVFCSSSNTLKNAVKSPVLLKCSSSLVDLSLDEETPFLLTALMLVVLSKSP